MSPHPIEATSDFELTSLSPAHGKPGSFTTLTGKGFDDTVEVRFYDRSSRDLVTRSLTGTVQGAIEPTSLTVVVPALDPDVGQWWVRAIRGSNPSEEIVSRAHAFAFDGKGYRYGSGDGGTITVVWEPIRE